MGVDAATRSRRRRDAAATPPRRLLNARTAVSAPHASFGRRYFATCGIPVAATPFLGDVPIRFGIDNPEEHYHVPLLCSPWTFSTYRGS